MRENRQNNIHAINDLDKLYRNIFRSKFWSKLKYPQKRLPKKGKNGFWKKKKIQNV